MKTTDTYRAAFYLMWGGRVTDVATRTLPANTASKKGYPVEWTIYMSNVPDWAVVMYDTGQIYGSLHDYIRARKKLKRTIKKLVPHTH